MSLKVLVADDEPFGLRRLARLLREAGCEVVAELQDGPAVLEWLESGGTLDAAFLDIHMPGLDGLELAAELPPGLPIVLVTAHPEHAVRAYELDIVDYLLKPATPQRLALALERIRNRLGRTATPRKGPLRFPVKAGDGFVMLDLAKTTHFTFEDGAVWAHAGERFRCNCRSLTDVEELFPLSGLLRVHRHVLLRPEAIIGIRTIDHGRLMARLVGGRDVEVSRGAAPKLKERLGLS